MHGDLGLHVVGDDDSGLVELAEAALRPSLVRQVLDLVELGLDHGTLILLAMSGCCGGFD